MTHTCVNNLNIIGPDDGLSPGRRQAIIWTSAGILLIGPSRTNFSEILIEILTFSFKKMRFKVSSVEWRPFSHGFNVLSALALCSIIVALPPHHTHHKTGFHPWHDGNWNNNRTGLWVVQISALSKQSAAVPSLSEPSERRPPLEEGG